MGERLKQLRIEKGLTLKIVADHLQIGLMTYAHYEYGDREPSIETLVKICDFFDVTADYLLGRTDY